MTTAQQEAIAALRGIDGTDLAGRLERSDCLCGVDSCAEISGEMWLVEWTMADAPRPAFLWQGLLSRGIHDMTIRHRL